MQHCKIKERKLGEEHIFVKNQPWATQSYEGQCEGYNNQFLTKSYFLDGPTFKIIYDHDHAVNSLTRKTINYNYK